MSQISFVSSRCLNVVFLMHVLLCCSVKWNKVVAKENLGHFDLLYDEELAQSDLLQQVDSRGRIGTGGALGSTNRGKLDQRKPVATWK